MQVKKLIKFNEGNDDTHLKLTSGFLAIEKVGNLNILAFRSMTGMVNY